MKQYFYWLLIFACFACSDRTNYNLIEVSDSIEESKKREVFIAEYKIVNDEKINDTITIKVKEAWVEYRYKLMGDDFTMKTGDGLHLIVDTESGDLCGCITINIKDATLGKELYMNGNGRFISFLNKIPPDTIIYNLQENAIHNENDSLENIGTLIFVKK